MFRRILKRLSGGNSAGPEGASAIRSSDLASADSAIAEGNRAEEKGDFSAACEHYREAVAAAPRASIRFATFAHTTSNTRATDAMRMNSARENAAR